MKAKEIKELSTADLTAKIAESKKTYATSKFNHALSPLENPMVIRAKRKEIAKLQTEFTTRKQSSK